MSKGLPEKSRSKGVQERHTRRVKTREGYKDVVVNPDVRKDVARSEPLRPRSRVPVESDRRALKPRDSGPKGLAFPKPDDSLRSRVFRNAEDFWVELLKDDDWFNDRLGFFNRNFGELKEALFVEWQWFNNRNPGLSPSVALEKFKDEFSTFDFIERATAEDYVTWRKFGDLDGLESIVRSDIGALNRFDDPFDGQVFDEDNVLVDGWVGFDMNTTGMNAFALKDVPEQLEEVAITFNEEQLLEAISEDSRLLNRLSDYEVPFLHFQQSVVYRNPNPDFIVIPRKDWDRAEPIIRRVRGSTADRWS